MDKVYIGIDNGTSGAIGFIKASGESLSGLASMFTKREQSYTKTAQQISRIDFPALYNHLAKIVHQSAGERFLAVVERPYVNPKGFKATASALRALEATLIALEMAGVPYMYIDSKEWQKDLLPSGLKGTPELKAASLNIGTRLFPDLQDEIIKQKDADAILIAEYARRRQL